MPGAAHSQPCCQPAAYFYPGETSAQPQTGPPGTPARTVSKVGHGESPSCGLYCAIIAISHVTSVPAESKRGGDGAGGWAQLSLLAGGDLDVQQGCSHRSPFCPWQSSASFFQVAPALQSRNGEGGGGGVLED